MTSVKLFKTIAFIGFGLINSSLARVVKTKGLAEKIHAYSRMHLHYLLELLLQM